MIRSGAVGEDLLDLCAELALDLVKAAGVLASFMSQR